jgi:hypothetical protein
MSIPKLVMALHNKKMDLNGDQGGVLAAGWRWAVGVLFLHRGVESGGVYHVISLANRVGRK